MSFYGNVTYYLSNAFSKIIYRNANAQCTHDNIDIEDGVNCPDQYSYEYTLSPRSRNDDVILENGNKWILFADPNGTQGNNQIQIFHRTTSNNEGTASPSVSAATSGTTYDQLNFKQVITLPKIVFDEAGHITSVSNVRYQLAEPPGMSDIADIRDTLGDIQDQLDDLDENTASEIQQLKSKVNVWDMISSGDPNNRYKEAYGIGTNLHDVMVLLGTRRKFDNAYDNQPGYEPVDQEVAKTNPSCLIGVAYMGYNNANNAGSVASGNRMGVRALLDILVDNHVIEASDRTALRRDFFSIADDVNPNNPNNG